MILIYSLPSMYTLFRLRWLGHVHRMEDGHIPKGILYGKLLIGRRSVGRPHLCWDACKRDMKALDIDPETWEGHADDRGRWRNILNQHLKSAEKKLVQQAEDKRARWKEGHTSDKPATTHRCDLCGTVSVNHALVSTVTWDAAEQRASPETKMYFPWSTLTDRGLPTPNYTTPIKKHTWLWIKIVRNILYLMSCKLNKIQIMKNQNMHV